MPERINWVGGMRVSVYGILFADPSACIDHLYGGKVYLPPPPPSALDPPPISDVL